MSNPNPIRALFISLATIAVLALGGCGGTGTEGVSPADGPATSETTPADEPTDETTTEEPTEEPTDTEATPATFKEKYIYEDKVEVEVIKIQHGKVTRADAEYAEPEAKAGDDYVIFTVRVKNGSKAKIDASSSWSVTYGPDGTEAESPYLASKSNVEEDISGKILPGRSKTATDTFAVPRKYQNDPVLEFTFDFEHEAAIFSGSIKQST
jgi:hypothetical protein